MEYVNSVEKHSGHQIMKLNILAEEDVKVLRSDNGGEYTSDKFTKFCADKGILHEFTVPYCPQQNGVAERLNRTIMEGARSMLYQAKLPLDFWAEACSIAVYLHNRSPTAALKDETPFQRLFGRRPDISNLRVFGCVSYVHVPDSQRRKLDAKAHRAIFVGYPPGVKGYKLYDLEKKKFIVSRNVQFFEENFDHSDEKVKSDDAGQADLKFIYPDMNQENESVPVPLLPEAPQVQDNVKPPVQEYVEPAPVQNVETVGAPPRESLSEEEPVRRTYQDAFMEEVRNLGPVRQRRMPSRFQDYDCLSTGNWMFDLHVNSNQTGYRCSSWSLVSVYVKAQQRPLDGCETCSTIPQRNFELWPEILCSWRANRIKWLQ